MSTHPARRAKEVVVDVAATETESPGLSRPVSYRTLQRMRLAGEKIACLTCYDATTARWLERAGVPMLLVGDTAAEMILGLPGTIHAPLEFMIQITAAVKRGAPNCFVMGDMPFMSYQADPSQAMYNAARFLTEGFADAVKVEVNGRDLELVSRFAHAGIPTVAHLGCRPQQAKRLGGYASAGRTSDEASSIVRDAIAMTKAGATMLLLEAMPGEVSQRVVESVEVPVIGCGAGPACHGQVVVLHDLLGLSDWQPGFAPAASDAGESLRRAGAEWVRRVRASDLPAHSYEMTPDEAERFRQSTLRGQ